MHIDQQEHALVENRLNRQNGLVAATAVAFWAMPVLALWYWLYQIDDRFAPLMMVASGALIGLAVRFHGRGYTSAFALIAFAAHLCVVAAAMLLNLSLGEGQSLLAFIFVALYVAGAWSAAFIARVTIPFHLQKAYFALTEQRQHSSITFLKNRWYIAVPVTLVLTAATLVLTMFVLAGVDQYSDRVLAEVSAQQQKEMAESRAIDVTTTSLEALSTDDAMRHAYAFFHGYLPSPSGRRYSDYPQSEYKAKRVLAYLAEERGEPRAAYVLGRLNYNEDGMKLIKTAANGGDIYAKIHLAAEFGCYGEQNRAKDLLHRLDKLTESKRAHNEIASILTAGFTQVCAEFESPDFAFMYLQD